MSLKNNNVCTCHDIHFSDKLSLSQSEKEDYTNTDHFAKESCILLITYIERKKNRIRSFFFSNIEIKRQTNKFIFARIDFLNTTSYMNVCKVVN
jgi:hypothetical protein